MENDGATFATLQLASDVMGGDSVETLRALLATLQSESDAAADASTWSLVHALLIRSGEHVAQIVADTALLAALRRALQSPHPPCESVLQCLLALKHHHAQLFALDWELALAIANLMRGGDSVSDNALPLLLDVLKALAHECTQSTYAIESTVAAALGRAEPLFALKCLRCVLAARDSWTNRYAPALDELDASAYIQECVGAAITVLRFGTTLEAVVTVQALLSNGVDTIALALVVTGGATALVQLSTSTQCDRLRDAALALLGAICKTDERYVGVLIQSQLKHRSVDILAPGFCASGLAQFVGFDFARCIEQLSSRNDADVRQALAALPRSIYVLVVLYLDFELLRILLELLPPDARDDVSDLESDIWTLLLEILYELPTVGAASVCGSQEAAVAALQFLNADQPLARRQQGALLLATPLAKSASLRHALVEICDGIVTLVRLLAIECDAAFAQTLSELVRDLAAESSAWATEIDFVVRSVLDSGDSDRSVHHQNVLSIYRSSKRAVLGRDGDDAVVNLQRSIEILESGHELEKRIVLTWLRARGASWTREHWRVLSARLFALVPILLSETAELKQLAAHVLAAAAAADRECCAHVATAQRVYCESDPSFFRAVQQERKAIASSAVATP